MSRSRERSVAGSDVAISRTSHEIAALPSVARMTT
jgi:hypothetical protein